MRISSAVCGLVEHDENPARSPARGDADALLLAGRQLVGVAAGEGRVDMDRFQQSSPPFAPFRRWSLIEQAGPQR